MLQTMMQTVCQLVNNEIITNKKSTTTANPPRLRRDQPDFQSADHRENWSAQNSVPRQTLLPKTVSSNEVNTLSSRMNNGMLTFLLFGQICVNSFLATPIELNSYRHSSYGETHDTSRKVSRPTSAVSIADSNTYEYSKQTQSRRNTDHDSRLTMISPIDVPSSYDMFESGLPKTNPMNSMLRSGMNSSSGGPGTNAPPSTSAVSDRIG